MASNPRRCGYALALALAQGALTPAARAEPPRPASEEDSPSAASEGPAPKVPRRPSTSWYGYQILLADLAATILAVTAFEEPLETESSYTAPNPHFFAPAVATYALGGPILHAVHGGAVAASVGLRLGGPAAGALFGAAAGSGSKGAFIPGWVAGAGLGIGVGAVVAMILDAALLAHEPGPPARDAMRVTPTVTASSAGGAVGLGGTF